MIRALIPLLATLCLGCRIIFVGDSITEQMGYVDLIAQAWSGADVDRAACGGTTTWQWQLDGPAPGFHCAVLNPNPIFDLFALPLMPADVAYVLLGTNDSAFHAWSSNVFLRVPIEPDLYALYLGELIDRLLEEGTGVVILLSPPDPLSANQPRLDRLAGYREKIAETCAARFEVGCGPDLSQVLTEPGDYADNVHPSAQGHAKIACAITGC